MRDLLRYVASTLLLIGAGCHSGDPIGNSGVTFSSSVAIKSYVKLVVGLNGSKESRFYFPILEIYDRAGNLIYASHDLKRNTEVLDGLPEAIAGLKPIAATASLAKIVDEIPDLEAHRKEIVDTNRLTILSVDLEDCHACSVQERTLNETERKILRTGSNLITVKVTK